MILVYVVILAIVIGYLCGGRLGNYLHEPLRGVFLPIASFAFEAFAPLVERLVSWPIHVWHPIFVSVQYILLFVFIFLNRQRRPMILLGIANLLNAIVITYHGFRMPVSPMVYRYDELAPFVERITSGELFEYTLVGWDAPLVWLGDTIPIMIGKPGLASIGDLVLAIGIGWLMIQLMKQKAKQPSETSVTSQSK